MPQQLKVLDVVALIEDLPERGLLRGHVGTVVETLAHGVFEVEFADESGKSYAMTALREEQLLLLRHEPAESGPSK